MFSKTSAKKCKLNSPSETSDSQIKSDASFDQESEVKLWADDYRPYSNTEGLPVNLI